ncbi:MAG: hypothetical protein ACYDIE_08720, partial [Candidatus Krumholzibacteriia bacterium]
MRLVACGRREHRRQRLDLEDVGVVQVVAQEHRLVAVVTREEGDPGGVARQEGRPDVAGQVVLGLDEVVEHVAR